MSIRSIFVVFILTILISSLVWNCNAASEVLQLHGSGAEDPAECIWDVMDNLIEQSSQPIHLTYRAISTSSSIQEFASTNTINSFGIGDSPLPTNTYNSINGGVVQLPVLATSISFFHSVPKMNNLKLTPCILARIYSKDITKWGHGDIVALNPSMPQNVRNMAITVAVRAESSSSTGVVTKYMSSGCDKPVQRLDSKYVGDNPSWPASMTACSGVNGMINCIKNKQGTIGYMETKNGSGLSEVLLPVTKTTGAGNDYKTAKQASINEAITTNRLPNSAENNMSSVNFVNAPGNNVWPLVKMTYLYVRKNLSSIIDNKQEQTLLIAFLKAMYDNTYVQQCANKYGFTTINSGGVKNFALAGINKLSTVPNAVEWKFEKNINAVSGADTYVFSFNRKSSNNIKIETIENKIGNLLSNAARKNELNDLSKDLMKEITTLSKTLEATEKRLNTMESIATSLLESFGIDIPLN